jgi:predicted metal-dependent phosphoesterase TrpH
MTGAKAMEKFIDLHTHTTKSDGSMTPAELVRYAAEKGLVAVAITDHDTVDGVAEAIQEGSKAGVEVIAGVEISVDYSPEMHILGYFKDKCYMRLESTLEELRMYREIRNPKIINILSQMGVEISMEEVEKKAGESIISRAHIAKVLVDKGYANDIKDAFYKFLSPGRPAYVKKDKLAPESAIKKIIEAGGVPVLAHPIYLNKSYNELDELLAHLAKVGLAGIEAYYTENTEEDNRNLVKLAIKNDLLATGGSDFHGSFKTNIDIGTGYGNLKIPYAILERLKVELVKHKEKANCD